MIYFIHNLREILFENKMLLYYKKYFGFIRNHKEQNVLKYIVFIIRVAKIRFFRI